MFIKSKTLALMGKTSEGDAVVAKTREINQVCAEAERGVSALFRAVGLNPIMSGLAWILLCVQTVIGQLHSTHKKIGVHKLPNLAQSSLGN